MESWQQSYQSTEVATTDTSSVFLTKSLLYPVVAVVTLVGCLRYWGEPLHGPHFLIAVLAFILAADFLGVAPVRGRRSRSQAWHGFLNILLRWLLVVGFIWILMRVSGFSHRFNGAVLLAWASVTPAVLWLVQLGAERVFQNSRAPPRKAVIAGLTQMGVRLEHALHDNPLLRMQVVGYFEDREPRRLEARNKARVLGGLRALPEFVLKHDIQVVYITLPMSRDPRVMNLLEQLRDSTVSIHFVPDLFMFSLIQGRIDLVDGIPLVAVCESPFFGIRSLLKRLMDIAVSGSALLLISPLMLGVAAAIRLTSPGPAIFRQTRYGLDGKPITVYKFRSMTVTEDGDRSYTQVSRNDARVTPLGAFIRKTSIDELPQLLNVLEGTMSIVGPRPHAVAVNEQYRRLIPGYMVRHKIKPGITGWAQINGYRGGDDLESMRKRIEFDLEYLRHWSLWFDLLILFKTATVVWNDRHAY